MLLGHDKYNFEVYDSRTNNFVHVETLPAIRFIAAVTFGYKIFVFQGNYNKNDKSEMLIYCYNKEQNAWIQENNLQLKKRVVGCAKMCKK